MRPPQNAGESGSSRPLAHGCRCRFNEAPAERGGKSAPLGPARLPARDASMRPPQNAGESLAALAARGTRPASFNEAPAERGGKLPNAARAGSALRPLQ